MKSKQYSDSKRYIRTFLVVVLTLAAHAVIAEENWNVIMDKNPSTDKLACIMESASHKIDDGQTSTTVKLWYTGSELYALTKSNIDLSYPDVGLQVDDNKQFAIDRLYKERDAVFSEKINDIHRQFIAGLTARLNLGFWPTWPKTKTRTIEFSLIGYTRTYAAFEKCRTGGGVDQK
jgi:hypothetical protein